MTRSGGLRFLSAFVLCLIISGCSQLDSLERSDVESAASDSPRQLLITVRQQSDLAAPILGDPAAFYLRRRGYGPLPSVNRVLDRIAEDYEIRRVDGWLISSIGQYCEVYELSPGQDVSATISEIASDPRIEIVQAMNLFDTQAIAYDDPYVNMQPAIGSLAIAAAHEISTGRGVTVAVVDSGVDARHQELRGSVRGRQDLVDGRFPSEAEIHGTAVAGIIGSAANNGYGIVGIAPDAIIVPLRACWTVDSTSGRARCSSFSLAQAIEFAIRVEADVINLSLSGPDDPLLRALIDAAIGAGSIVVAALPPASDEKPSFPSSHTGVIAVEAQGTQPPSTAVNALRAPGVEVISTVPDDRYGFFSGNSMSTAFVTGVSALLRERNPAIRSEAVLELLSRSMSDGLINACRAVAEAAESNTSC